MIKTVSKVAFLGPIGTYSHFVAEKNFPKEIEKIPMPSIFDIFAFAAEAECNRGIVPVENSSGGPIAETIDLLINNRFNLKIEESINLNVKLALLGKKKEKISTLFSHSIPFYHCDSWIRKTLPDAIRTVTESTSKAALRAASTPDSAAIASLDSAKIYGLDIIEYPIEQDVPNVTQFYKICLNPEVPAGPNVKTSIAAFLRNTPGSLYEFLEPFKTDKVNLCRIISRPIYGKPSEYSFYIDIDGSIKDTKISSAIEKIKIACSRINLLSSYKTGVTYMM